MPGPGATAVAATPEGGTETWDGVTRPRSRGGNARFLTDVIVELGLVPRDRVESAIDAARASGVTPEAALLERGEIDQVALSRAVAERHGLDHLDLTAFNVDMGAANLINNAAARRYDAVPVAFLGDRGLLIAMADPANVLALDDIALMTGYDVKPAVSSREDIAALVSRLTRLDDVVAAATDEAGEDDAEIVDLRESADEAPVIKLVNQIIAQAAEQGASDVHMAPEGGQMRVRFRVDGVLKDTTTVPRRMVAGVISRIKIMAELDIAEKRLPQDGRVGLTIDGRHIDLRVVTLPSVHGEGAVMRILDKSAVVMELDKLGMLEPERVRFQRAFHQAYGAVLVTGPTGSGKSTSLYAALGELNSPEKNIITIEDPVEYEVAGITQLQVHNRAGLTFATGLRSMMRADPDVIMVGEVRDREAAQIAVEAALTGHLVLSTLHTNDAPTAITRLIEMGIEPFLVASAIDCVVGQRLARTLCQHCKRRTILSADVLRDSGFPARMDIEAYEPVGCSRCGGSGYKGRIGLYEVMTVTEEMRKLIINRASADEIAVAAMRAGMRRLREDGLEKVRQGRTSIAEVARVTGTGVAEEY
ncbi:Flp pilus assembly complex ATPase component TadA [Paraconexibacter antarcticus]|uniref:Flp pilus assembly complex ATPase component TadA n=1 Tax=Paraconexibacter antarcticus TaxID=2949664 RepID=A0ABY5DP17_9ACTN|nr:ATPase, T2SS/T4P/T4SS family [Paraconexibacter antarcticus]UTI62537.1 Flp pilus assembly complex ATPase component TadA [Paraconexibacter antarcticus]